MTNDNSFWKQIVDNLESRISYSKVIRYLLTAFVLAISYEFYQFAQVKLELNLQGFSVFVAVGVLVYWIYRPIFYDVFFIRFLDLVVTKMRKWFNWKWIYNYRLFFQDSEGIQKQYSMDVYYALTREEWYSPQGDNTQKASTIHFFAMSSLIFLGFAAWSLFHIYSENLDFNRSLMAFQFFALSIISLAISILIDIDLEKYMFKYILSLKINNSEKFEKFMNEQKAIIDKQNNM